MRRTVLAAALMGIAAAAAPAQAQERPPRPAVSDYRGPAAFPNANKAAVAEHLSRARKIAGDDLFLDFAHRCIISPRYPQRVGGIQYEGLIEPTKIFDQLYS